MGIHQDSPVSRASSAEGADQPLIAVLTPVYNGERLLPECIRSVLGQTYSNFEYTIVNNCSTDRSQEVAEAFAKQDPRIRVHNNSKFLSVVGNYNNAFGLISERAKYCKVVGADDWLFPTCLAEMVKVAEQYPTVGMVSSYVLVESYVGWDRLPYPSTFTRGREICRMRLLRGVKVFGGPSASLLRSSVVKQRQPFYKVDNYHGDTEAYLDLLREYDFGFVHQVLSYNRRGEDSPTTAFCQSVNSYLAADVEELTKFGPIYLTTEELERRLREANKAYYTFLAQSVLELRGKEFWDYHRHRMRQLGVGIDSLKIGRYVLYRLIDAVLNPKRTVESVLLRVFKRDPPSVT
jgi:glycosyltransferase involved in cell wall biosynthesis